LCASPLLIVAIPITLCQVPLSTVLRFKILDKKESGVREHWVMMKLKYRRVVVMMGNQNTSQSSQNFFLMQPRVFDNILKLVIHQRRFLCLFKGDESRPAALNKISLIYDHNKAVFTHTKSRVRP
jgi:hypothetical protein